MPEIYATAHFTQYGRYDKSRTQREKFLREVNSPDGACSTDTKNYWKSVQDWRTLLVTVPYEERKQIVFEYLDFNVLDDDEINSLTEAFNRLDPFIATVSKRALISYFEKNIEIHKARAEMNKHQSKWCLLITTLGGEILAHEQELFIKNKCPSIFWKEERLELMEEECEKYNHSSRCITYIKDGECNWLDRQTKKSLKVGMQRKNYMADLHKWQSLKNKVVGMYIEELRKDPRYNYEFLIDEIGKYNFIHPDTFLLPDNQKRCKFTKQDIRFVEEFYEIYDVTVSDDGNTIRTGLKKPEEVY